MSGIAHKCVFCESESSWRCRPRAKDSWRCRVLARGGGLAAPRAKDSRPCRSLRINTLELFFESEDVKKSPKSLQKVAFFYSGDSGDFLEILETFWRLFWRLFGAIARSQRVVVRLSRNVKGGQGRRGGGGDLAAPRSQRMVVRLSRKVKGGQDRRGGGGAAAPRAKDSRPCRSLRINTMELFFESEDVKKSPKKSPESLQNLQKVSKISRISKIIFAFFDSGDSGDFLEILETFWRLFGDFFI